MKEEYFTRFPNKYLMGDTIGKMEINRKFFIVYILIDRYRSYENYSWITIKEIFDIYGYSKPIRKNKAFNDILDVLVYMIKNDMIKIYQNLNEISFDTGIKIKIIPQNFYDENNFTKFSTTHFKKIIIAGNSYNKDDILIVFLYICSFIGMGGNKKPAAFYKSLIRMSKDTGLNKKAIQAALLFLLDCSNQNQSLLIKEEPPKGKHLPNIYVLNKPGYEREIDLAKKELIGDSRND